MTYLNLYNKFSVPVEFTQLISLFSFKIPIYVYKKLDFEFYSLIEQKELVFDQLEKLFIHYWLRQSGFSNLLPSFGFDFYVFAIHELSLIVYAALLE